MEAKLTETTPEDQLAVVLGKLTRLRVSEG